MKKLIEIMLKDIENNGYMSFTITVGSMIALWAIFYGVFKIFGVL